MFVCTGTPSTCTGVQIIRVLGLSMTMKESELAYFKNHVTYYVSLYSTAFREDKGTLFYSSTTSRPGTSPPHLSVLFSTHKTVSSILSYFLTKTN